VRRAAPLAIALLRNPEEDPSRSVFDPSIRGRTDRFVLRLRKPRGAHDPS
jgi:predicted methyltransferase